MIADLHLHYPMHLISDPDEDLALERMVRPWRRRHPRDWLRALVLEVASRLFNYRDWSSGHRVDLTKMHDGGVGLGFSVLLDPATEFDAAHWYGAPRHSYVRAIEEQLEMVESVVGGESDRAGVVHDAAELRETLASRRIALVHCIEGGFQLGADDEEVERTVERLARRGVAYVTLAHLFWRRVATNTNAFPFLKDGQYRHWFPEPTVG